MRQFSFYFAVATTVAVLTAHEPRVDTQRPDGARVADGAVGPVKTLRMELPAGAERSPARPDCLEGVAERSWKADF